jgi:hypothetical protein
VTVRRKSAKHRALAASREKALKAGRLEHWYAERAADKLAAERRGEKLAAEAVPANEREAWDAAYSGPEVGPAGGAWPEDGRHVARMVWRLPYNSGSNRPAPPRNP